MIRAERRAQCRPATTEFNLQVFPAFRRRFTENEKTRAACATWASRRPFAFGDEDLATSVVQQAREKDFALREFVHALVSSDSFRMK
jgi:hypothetical protein